MPIRKVKGGYQWGKHGKVYKTKEGAEQQARAVYARGYKEPKQMKFQDWLKKMLRWK